MVTTGALWRLTDTEVVRSSAVLPHIKVLGYLMSRSEPQHGVIEQAVVSEQHHAAGPQHLAPVNVD